MTSGAISATTMGLARGVLKTMFLRELKLVSVALLGAVLMASGAVAALGSSRQKPPQDETRTSSIAVQVGQREPVTVVLRSDAGQAPAEGGRWGQLRGRVVLSGPPPAMPVVADPNEQTLPRDHRGGLIADAPPRRLPDYEVIAKRGEPIRSERLLVDPETRGVRNALVYLLRPSAVREEARRATPVNIQFRADRGVFVPHVIAAMQGTEIMVSTVDSAVYHIRAQDLGTEFVVEEDDSSLERPRVRSAEAINSLFGNFRDGRHVSLHVQPKASRPRPLPIYDDTHSWMSAWWLVLDHPYFAVTDERGTFEIRDVPTGPQQVLVWQESVQPLGKVFEGEVVIREGETVRDFMIEPARIRLTK